MVMGLFNKKKEEESKKEGALPKKTQEVKSLDDKSGADNKKDSSVNKENESKKVLSENMDGTLAYDYITRPWVTEKTHELISNNKYVFKIRFKTNKYQIRKAVEKLYGVTVEKVNIVNIPSKKRRFGRVICKKSAIKKAIVTLKEGDKIEVFG
jgi:large subunit ribosomal protein L23